MDPVESVGILAEGADGSQRRPSSGCPGSDARRRPTTTPGIGPINALTMLPEVGNPRRFQHHRQFP